MTDNAAFESAPAMRGLFAGWTRAVTRHAILVLVLVSVLSGLAAWFTTATLAIDTSTTDMISAETPFRRNAIDYDRAFPQFNDLIVAVIDAPSSDAASAMANALVTGLRKDEHRFRNVDYPEGHPFFKRNGLLFSSTDDLSALADQLAAAEPFLATLAHQPDIVGLFGFLSLALNADEATANSDALRNLIDKITDVVQHQPAGAPTMLAWRDLLSSHDQITARQVVVIRPNLDGAGLAPGADALAAVRALTDQIRREELQNVTVRLTGSVAIEDEELRSVVVGGEKAGLVTVGLVVLLLVLGLRSIRFIVPTIFTLVVGLIWTAAFAALTIGHLNLISVAFAVLFIGLGVDFSIHYCLYYRECAARYTSGALAATGAGIGGSLAISAICAAAGFLSFLPTDYKGLAELGLISGGGMGIAFFLNMTLMPAILACFPGKPTPQASSPNPQEPFTRRHYRAILVLAGSLGLGAAAAIPFAQFDFNPMNLKDPEAESVATFHDLSNNPRNGIHAIDILATDLEKARADATRIESLPDVGKTVSLFNFVPADQEEKLTIIEDIAFFLAPALMTVPAQNAKPASFATAINQFQVNAATYLADAPASPLSSAIAQLNDALLSVDATDPTLLEDLNYRLTGYLPAMLGNLRNALQATAFGIDEIPAEIRRNWVAPDGRARVQVWPKTRPKSNADLQHFASAMLAAAPNAVGTPITISEAGIAVVSAFRDASVIALILVTLLLVVLLRDIAGLALIMLPLALAAILTGGTSVLLNLPFNFANIIVLPLLFGLGVASGVHMVIRSRNIGQDENVMLTSTPRAVLFSALTTIASFGSLALSGHLGMTSMGQLLTIAIGYTLICMLIVLPALMAWQEKRAL